jgi:diguanylate cyclase (GGDEF)-like protein
VGSSRRATAGSEAPSAAAAAPELSAAAPVVPAAALPSRGPGWWRLSELLSAEQRARPRQRIQLAALWFGALALSVAAGVANVRWGWNAVEFTLAGLPVDLTFYPPFVISILLAIWVGPAWGAVPIYLANLASALASGLPFALSAVFALAGAIETLVVWGALVALRVDPDLRRGRDLAGFLGAGLVGAVCGSLAAILWNVGHALDPAAGQRVFRGWVLGDLAQLLLVVAPVLHLAGERLRCWIDHRFAAPPRHEFGDRGGVLLGVAIFGLLGAVVTTGVVATVEEVAGTAPEAVVARLREIVLAQSLLTGAIVAATAIFSTALARRGERARVEARRDTLTGCLNRRSFDEHYALEAERSRRLGMGIGLLLLDADRFKEVNDRFGHDAGDLALRQLARRIEGQLRQTDLLFRWGGEEFLVLLPHTDAHEVARAAERIRAAVAAAPLAEVPRFGRLALTVSIGAAATAELPAPAEALVRRADQACYAAKRRGRDRVVAAD